MSHTEACPGCGHISCARAEIEQLKSEVAAVRTAWQRHIDAAVHYRNLSIALGAKPNDMLDAYDRGLAAGADAQTLEEVRERGPAEAWAEAEAAQAEALNLRSSLSERDAVLKATCRALTAITKVLKELEQP